MPLFLLATGLSSLGHPQRPSPVLGRFAHSKGSSPSNTNTVSKYARVGDDLQRWCLSDHQTVADRHDTPIVGDVPAESENLAF